MISTVKLREKNVSMSVGLSAYYDSINSDLIDKWQGVLDIASDMCRVPSALIMRLHSEVIEVLVKNQSHDNPYEVNETCELGLGLYCETVIGTDDHLHIANALDSRIWKDNPDVNLNMISYFGLPIKWADGSFFGTICVLDSETRQYDENQRKLLRAFRDTIEKDLDLLEKQMCLNENLREIQKTHQLILDYEKDKLTNQLVSSISHEISTPIGVALTTASYMDYVIKKDPDAYNKLREGASLVQKNLDQASKMLKTFKQVTENREMDEESLIHLDTFIKSVVMSMKYDLQRYGVEVKVLVDESLYVNIHSHALVQILLNLTSNAILHAFKEEGDKYIDVEVLVVKEGIELLVSDNGIGMNKENCDKAFEPFVRYDIETEGSGLGLTIVKDLVERVLKGSIECMSDEKGTCFKMHLPVEVTYETH